MFTSPPSPTALTLTGFGVQNDRRETLIKASRDATSLSKKLIFHLHRNGSRADTLTKQAEIVSLLRNVAAKQGLADPATRARYERNLGPGIEEFVRTPLRVRVRLRLEC